MTDPFTPSRAAAETPEGPALVMPGRVVAFGQLPALVAAHRDAVAGRPFVACVATPELETFALLWTALELGVPFVPLHPRLPEAARTELLARLDDAPPPPGTAAVVWTSGTTGEPRGVCLSRENLVAAAAASAANLGWRDDDRWLCTLPLAHVGGLTIPVRCLLARRAVVALPRFEERAVLDAIRGPALRPTLASFVPTMLARLLAADDTNALSRLRAILVGGDAAPPALLDECRARGVTALPTYGLTEAGGQVCTQRLDSRDRGRAEAGSGQPLSGLDVRIDGGRVLVRGPSVCIGFLGEPPGARDEWLDTGDLGHLDEAGRLHVDGRARDIIVTGGENVVPSRVERALCAIDGVKAALVFGIADDTWGQIVAAAIVSSPEARERASRIRVALCSRLAPHELPRRVVFVDALPTNAAGKVDRRSARALFAS